MIKPEVSIIMPVYNAAATLEATIASVLGQSFEAFELIAVNDGSTDESLSTLEAHASRDPRIRIVSQPNAGLAATRNRGAELGKAPFIAFVDSDDLWRADKLERHMTLHHHDPFLAASYARVAFIPQEAKGLDEATTLSSLGPKSPRLIDVLGENPICTPSNLVMRRDWFDRLRGFDRTLRRVEDQEFLARLIATGGRIGGIDAALTGYRLSPGGLSMDLSAMHATWREVALRFLAERDLAPLEALYYRYLARRVLRGGGPPTQALRYVITGLRIDASAFLRDRRRGLSTLAAALGAPFIPTRLRLRFFA